jgi:hypothetical protein
MKRMLMATLALAVLTGGAAAAHHSYGAYDRTKVLEIEGTLESFEWINPHSFLKIRQGDAIYLFEGQAVRGLERLGVTRDTFKTGDRLVLSGNPRHDVDETRVVNLASIHRPADGWRWSRGQFPTVGTMGGPGGPAAPSGSNR